jgi:meso-butanediol dehydrogenase / (S,S)-butanediol dehydrogenase / diacetyl reductase
VAGRLAGKVAIVTGAASGIGRATAELFAEEGAELVLADVDVAAGESLARELAADGARARFVRTDLGRVEEAQALPQAAAEAFGKVDVLANCAGTSSGQTIFEISPEEWRRIVDVNLTGLYFCSEAAARLMAGRHQGKIVNISSLVAKGVPTLSPAYVASKSGVIGLTRYMAVKLAPYNINVNAVCPGVTRTPLYERIMQSRAEQENVSLEVKLAEMAASIPLRRENLPSDIAQAVLFLASDASRNITGQSYNVDGGVAFD